MPDPVMMLSGAETSTGKEIALARRRQLRQRKEKRFRRYGQFALGLAGVMLALLLGKMLVQGSGALQQTYIRLDIAPVTEPILSVDETSAGEASSTTALIPTEKEPVNYQKLVRESLQRLLPEVQSREEMRTLFGLVSPGAANFVRQAYEDSPELENKPQTLWVPASDDVDMFAKGKIDRAESEFNRILSDRQIAWIDQLVSQDRLRTEFNWGFFGSGDSREPELAGVLGAVIGSLWLMVVCLFIAFPLAVMTAVYLEEFANQNGFTDFLEVTINNLAAVPSIIFGLLGLALYLQFLELPRSSALAGGLTLALMILPVIIISTRAALRSVPGTIRDAARALGASQVQVVWHHVLPLAMPGVMTGTILGVARAIGETAPLLMIGMVAFVADIPGSVMDPAAAMPVQIYLWADSPEMAFSERTALAILVLLVFMMMLNGLAIWLRRKFERRW